MADSIRNLQKIIIIYDAGRENAFDCSVGAIELTETE